MLVHRPHHLIETAWLVVPNTFGNLLRILDMMDLKRIKADIENRVVLIYVLLQKE